ncbi:MAG: tripartite tricarboxylate transporter substrate binding protein [Polaromonas sp.]|nr:tripartite tricarboxylate transporter substrate binding protein [Polaromonas sp.]
MIVSLQAGSGSDLACRLVAESLGRRLNTQVVVENLPGAGGVVGAAKLFNARPDGYTLGALNNGLVCLVPNLPGRPPFAIEDLAPVSMVADLPSVLVITGTATTRTLAEFVAASKVEGSKYSYGSVGMGSPQHIAMEQLKLATGANMLHVPYRGGPQAVADVVAGQIQATWIAIPVAAQFIKTGQLRALAVGGPARSAALPEVPTLKEAGVTTFEYVPWIGLYAPPKTPSSLASLLNTHIQEVLSAPDTRAKLVAAGLEARPMSPVQFEQRAVSERRAMADVVKRIN